METSNPKFVNTILNIIGVNSLWHRGHHLRIDKVYLDYKLIKNITSFPVIIKTTVIKRLRLQLIPVNLHVLPVISEKI